jgi:hypothetical protein
MTTENFEPKVSKKQRIKILLLKQINLGDTFGNLFARLPEMSTIMNILNCKNVILRLHE